eukprot:TRINITY_DN8882_c0_g1_i1.p7 TRINITY_DN8882_c0_g1~~TRINITY_DN8882_c0_g1_i1.p7  ORF type:complete len:130 (-),score=16.11 TRINITY_DN8882_c0_g1_i1:101-490(-)
MNIAGVIKDWMLIFFSYYGFKQPVTQLNLIGYVFCCSGVGLYQYIKLQQIKSTEFSSKGLSIENSGSKKTDSLVNKANNNNSNSESVPLLRNTKGDERGEGDRDEILQEMQRLQREMQLLEQKLDGKGV